MFGFSSPLLFEDVLLYYNVTFTESRDVLLPIHHRHIQELLAGAQQDAEVLLLTTSHPRARAS